MVRVARSRGALITAGIVLAIGLGGTALAQSSRTVAAEQTAAGLAAPLAVLCERDPGATASAGADCPTAQRVARDGRNGADGLDGRGVVGTSLDEQGRLVVAYSDGTRQVVGRVVGDPGAEGEPGRGVALTTIEGGRLLVTFDDGTRVDVGRVVGEPGRDGTEGRGIASSAAVEGRLIVTYTDGSTQDAGPLPPGPRGEPGKDGRNAAAPARQTFMFPDGSSQVCVRDGGTDAEPVLRCGDRTGASTQPDPDAGTGTEPEGGLP